MKQKKNSRFKLNVFFWRDEDGSPIREEMLVTLKPICLRGEQVRKWCRGEADRRIAMDIAAMLGNQK